MLTVGVQDSAGKDPRIAMIIAIGFKMLSVSNYYQCYVRRFNLIKTAQSIIFMTSCVLQNCIFLTGVVQERDEGTKGGQGAQRSVGCYR